MKCYSITHTPYGPDLNPTLTPLERTVVLSAPRPLHLTSVSVLAKAPVATNPCSSLPVFCTAPTSSKKPSQKNGGCYNSRNHKVDQLFIIASGFEIDTYGCDG